MERASPPAHPFSVAARSCHVDCTRVARLLAELLSPRSTAEAEEQRPDAPAAFKEQDMSTAELSLVRYDDAGREPTRKGNAPGQPLHRIQEVRLQQGMSLRTASRHLGLDVRTIRAQEKATSDLRLSDLYRWQAALEVPVQELLVETEEPLSRPVMERARMVRLMKTAAALLEEAPNSQMKRMAENLIEQLVEIMPELKEVGPWHSVGQRRTLDEMGRIAQNPVSVECGDYGDDD